MALLSDEEVKKRLKEIPGWQHRGESIVKSFDRSDFVGSVKFVDSLVAPAEEMNHHPDIAISYDHVTLRWWTHTAGGITDRDRELAAKTNELVA